MPDWTIYLFKKVWVLKLEKKIEFFSTKLNAEFFLAEFIRIFLKVHIALKRMNLKYDVLSKWILFLVVGEAISINCRLTLRNKLRRRFALNFTKEKSSFGIASKPSEKKKRHWQIFKNSWEKINRNVSFAVIIFMHWVRKKSVQVFFFSAETLIFLSWPLDFVLHL